MFDLSIIIVNWNTCDLLDKCIESIISQTIKYNYEIIVVDNASKDDSKDMINQKYPYVKLIENLKNEGFARANNIGIKNSKGRYVLLSNTDIVVLDRAVDQMMAYVELHPEIGCLLPKCIDGDHNIRMCCRDFPTARNLFCEALFIDKIFPNNKFLKGRSLSKKFYDKIGKPESMPCCFMIIKKKTLEQVGFLDESFFFYGEDIDLCKRITEKNWEVIYFSLATVIHYGGSSTKKKPIKFIIEKIKSMLIYSKKHHNLFEYLLVKNILFLHYLLRSILAFILEFTQNLFGKPDLEVSKKYMQAASWIIFVGK